MKRCACLLVTLSLMSVAGCHSAMVQTTIHNGTSGTLRLIEVDYPSASFGTQTLAPGADFKYRFKILGSGPLKMVYTDASGKEQTSAGPELQEGLEGELRIEVTSAGVRWQPKVAHAR